MPRKLWTKDEIRSLTNTLVLGAKSAHTPRALAPVIASGGATATLADIIADEAKRQRSLVRSWYSEEQRTHHERLAQRSESQAARLREHGIPAEALAAFCDYFNCDTNGQPVRA